MAGRGSCPLPSAVLKAWGQGAGPAWRSPMHAGGLGSEPSRTPGSAYNSIQPAGPTPHRPLQPRGPGSTQADAKLGARCRVKAQVPLEGPKYIRDAKSALHAHPTAAVRIKVA